MKKAADDDAERWRVGRGKTWMLRVEKGMWEYNLATTMNVTMHRYESQRNTCLRLTFAILVPQDGREKANELVQICRQDFEYAKMLEEHAAGKVRVREEAASSFRVEAERAAYDAATAAGELADY
eukprot:2418831-Pleurochrysis_carterae.AAC.1